MRYRQLLPAALLLITPMFVGAQIAPPVRVDFTIDTRLDTHRISPYIYGSNGQSDDNDENIAARRQGGNRLTGYNWENNASNAGSDYIHHSDDYLTSTMPAAVQDIPGIVLTSFHDTSRAMGAYSLLTLPAAGYVARDKDGTVTPEQTAPSSRWVEVKFSKGSPFSLTPDLSDNAVYVDEEVSFLVNRYGNASTPTGVKGYSIDNEPALWVSTHPRIHPNKPTIAEVIGKGIDLARAVKGVDPYAEIFGPVAYGFAEYIAFQDAPDWESYRSYGTFLGAYLATMKEAETTYGRRLIDVLDLHWYPEAQGKRNDGGYERIAFSGNSDDSVAYARMQAPRSLWDSSYTEVSWIGQYFSPVALIPRVGSAIDRYYPGTKLAFTELNYGGDAHISGGIAMADVLGIFGKYGVYMSNYWGAIEGYVSSAYRIYRNYDGAKSTFGELHVRATSTDWEHSSIYASVETGERRNLHIILINKSLDQPLEGHLTLAGGGKYTTGKVYTFGDGRPEILLETLIGKVPEGEIIYTLPPLTVSHIVLEEGASGVANGDAAGGRLTLEQSYPNPAGTRAAIRYSIPARMTVHLALYDLLGRQVAHIADGEREAGEYTADFSTETLPAGAYIYRLQAGDEVLSKPMQVGRGIRN